MKLVSYHILLKWLGDSVVNVHVGLSSPKLDEGIRLMDENGTTLYPNTLYLGDPVQLMAFLEANELPSEGLSVVTVAGERLPEDLPENLTVIETQLSLVALYNLLQDGLRQFAEWNKRLHQIVYTNGGLQKMLDIAAEQLDATILLLNPGYKHMAGVYNPQVKDASADELQKNGYQLFETIQRIRAEQPIRQSQDKTWSEFISSDSGNYTMVHMIRYENSLVARLCVILNGPLPNPYYANLTALLADYITEYMFSNQGANYSSNAVLGSLVADLIECRLTEPVELEQRIKQIQLAVHRYYHVSVIQLDGQPNQDSIPWNYIITQLERIFPYSNITTYRSEILLLIRKTQRGSRLCVNRDKLMPLLEHYNGHIGIGNASEFLTSLPPVYCQVKDALRFGRVMNPEERIYFYEDYSVFGIIEMAGESCRPHLRSRNLVHLCNNEFIALLLYDRKSDTNFVEVMHTYLINERNATETAKEMYLHRNTMIYKIHKIEEIMGVTMDDPVLRERLLFSYKVMQYMKYYCKENLLTLKSAPQGLPENS